MALTYHKGSFCGGINIDINLIMCEDKIVITSILQSYVLHWYYKHLFYTGMDKMEAMICQNIYWTGIRAVVRKEVTKCDNFQHTKLSNIKYGKLPVKEPDKIPWNKLFVDRIRS